MKRLKEAEARIAEVEEFRKEKEKVRDRIFKETAKLYAEKKKKGIAGLEPLLKKLKITKKDLEDFYEAQAKETRSFVKETDSILKLNKKEFELFQIEEKSFNLFPPCSRYTISDWRA